MKVTNSTILDLLRCYTIENQSNWDQQLPLLQFAYNNTPQSATNKTPFEIVYGKKLHVPITTLSSDVLAANTLAQDHIQILQEATTAIQKHKNDILSKLTRNINTWILNWMIMFGYALRKDVLRMLASIQKSS